jgi:tetratricopeptide (TPR) repeat protein
MVVSCPSHAGAGRASAQGANARCIGRRRPSFSALVLLLLACWHGWARCDDSMVGKEVIQTEPELTLKRAIAGRSQIVANSVGVYHVEQARGQWLFLSDWEATVSGWARADRVVPLDDALVFFTRKIEAGAPSAFAYFMRAIVYRKAGRLADAMQDLESAGRLVPGDASVHIQKAIVLAKMRRYEQAVGEADLAIDRDPADPRLHCWRGAICRDGQRFDQAAGSFAEAIRLDPSFVMAYCDRAIMWQMKNDLRSAIRDTSTAIRLRPNFAHPYYLRGASWNASGNFDNAIVDFNECLRQDRLYASAYTGRGVAWFMKNQLAQSLADLNEAIRLEPRPSIALRWRARVRQDLGDLDSAIRDCTAAFGTRLRRLRSLHDAR